jgi:hypothetical protein
MGLQFRQRSQGTLMARFVPPAIIGRVQGKALTVILNRAFCFEDKFFGLCPVL